MAGRKRIAYVPGQAVSSHLTYVAEAPMRGIHRYARCRCSCGAEKDIRLELIRNGQVASCGCVRREMIKRFAGNKQGQSNKPVIGTCLETGEEVQYESMAATERDGFSPPRIRDCCHGKQKSHKGYAWRFALGGTHRAYAENNKEARQ